MSSSQVVAFDLYRVRLELRRAHRAAHGDETFRDVVLVRAEMDDCSVGWGECSTLSRPTYTSEYTAGAWEVLVGQLVPATLAGHGMDVVGHPMAASAIVAAVTDAMMRAEGANLAQALGAGNELPVRSAVPRCAVVSRGSTIDAVLAEVEAHIEGGAAMVKLKVSPLPVDLEIVLAVRSSWPDLKMAVDCNGSADRDLLTSLDSCELAYIEQPAPADGLVESAAWAGSIDTPIALDESIWSLGSMDAAVALAAGTIVNIKPSRMGGPHGGAAAVAHARNRGLGVFVGGMLETGIGRSASVAVAALGQCRLPTDLGPSKWYFDEDICEPLGLDSHGDLLVPSGPGIGRVPEVARLDEVTVDHRRLAR